MVTLENFRWQEKIASKISKEMVLRKRVSDTIKSGIFIVDIKIGYVGSYFD